MLTGSRQTVGIVGLGLIGGSLARAFTRAGHEVIGIDLYPGVTASALEAGVLAKAGQDPSLLRDADTVFVALYPDTTVEFIRRNARCFHPGATVIDCCGVKRPVCDVLVPFARTHGFQFLGGHPMAGSEQNGFSASCDTLFDGASFILTPCGAPDDVTDAAEALLLDAGFGEVIRTSPAHHDRMIAFTSQLPHLLACAYVMSPSAPKHAGFSAGSFRDVSRVAHLEPEMWTQLFTANRAPLLAELDELIGHLGELRAALDSGEADRLRALLDKGRRIKDSL